MSKSRQSTDAIEKIYITMRHLFYRGSYRPSGTPGIILKDLLFSLRPEIYGTMTEPEKVELSGLMYVLDRLPEGITQTPYVQLTGQEGYDRSAFKPIIPKKRRRLCYRIDDDQMNIEISRGRSDIYDILTHLTFLYSEADKIRNRAYTGVRSKESRIWKKIEEAALSENEISVKEREVLLIHISSILGRTYEETLNAYKYFSEPDNKKRFIKIIYWMGKTSQDDRSGSKKREITFNSILRESIGHHISGEKWANNIKKYLYDNGLHERKLHIISANMHSVSNMLFAFSATDQAYAANAELELYKSLSSDKNTDMRTRVNEYALEHGLAYLRDESGSNIDVQIIDLSKINLENTALCCRETRDDVIIVMDYAFGEQAFEVMDELLKPYNYKKISFKMEVCSISVMGKAGILEGEKGDIMIPNAHIFEGTADNYPFDNLLKKEDFKGTRLGVYTGPMITVLGTSLQNKDLLEYFRNSSWKSCGLEMEGAHYQKAIQVASKIRNHIRPDVKVMYAYYASDNPLETGSTLASGGLGLTGVKPTYLITKRILEKIIEPHFEVYEK